MDLQKILLANTRIAEIALRNTHEKVFMLLGKVQYRKAISAFKRLKINQESKSKNKLSDFSVIDKESYILKHRLEDISKVKIQKSYTIEKSSGYSGKSLYWVRYKGQDDNFTRFMKLGLKAIFGTEKKTTLLVNCLALGSWVGGFKFGRFATNVANMKVSKLTIVNIGTVFNEAIQVILDLHSNFDQVLLVGYPPFLTRVVESIFKGNHNDILQKMNVLAAGESFPEEWRDYIANMLGIDVNLFDRKIISAFGAADVGLEIGYEQPLSILLRRLLRDNPIVMKEYFGEDNNSVPLFFQYNPVDIWIEEVNHELVFTVDSGIPLVRYNLHDRGGILSFKDSINLLKRLGATKQQISSLKPMRLPLVYVYGRSDGSISIDGENFYYYDVLGILHDWEGIKKWMKFKPSNLEDLSKAMPHKVVAEKIIKISSIVSNQFLDSPINIINTFKMTNRDGKLEFLIELDKNIILSGEELENLETSLYKSLVLLMYEKLHSYKTLIEENLDSADINLKCFNFEQGPFQDDSKRIKMKYKI